MGRQRWTSRFTVEECFCLSVVELYGLGVFTSRIGSCWTLKQDNDAVNFTLVEVPGRAFGLRFNYDLIDHATGVRTPIEYSAEITTTRPHFGGRRYWFRCPLVRGVFCGRRVGRLYLPPNHSYFGCRHCYDLTYRSCQTHNKRLDALRRDPVALVASLRSNDYKQALLGVKACIYGLGRLQRHQR